MKRILAVLTCIAAALVAAPPVALAAGFEVGASMELSGIMRSDLDLDADTYTQGDDDSYWYHDVTIAFTGEITETASVYLSLSLLDRNWGDPGTSGAQAVMFDDDVAYAMFELAPVTVTAGRMMNDFGPGFKYVGDPVDRFRVDYAATDSVDVGLFTDKVDDGAFSGNVGDADRYGVIAETAVGDVKMGVQYIHTNDRFNDLKGGEVDVYATGAQGGLGYFLEAVYQAGSLYENVCTPACKPMGGVIGVSMDMAPLSVGVAFAYATDNFSADDEFAPTLFFGLDQDTAIMDFMALPDESIMALVLNADYAVSEALSAGARVAYADGVASMPSASTVTGSVMEADVYAEYTVVEGITWSVAAGYLVPSDITAADDPAMAAIHTIGIEL